MWKLPWDLEILLTPTWPLPHGERAAFLVCLRALSPDAELDPSSHPVEFQLLANEAWEQDAADRAITLAILQALRPSLSIDVGTYHGGSAAACAHFSEQVVTIDRDETARSFVDDLANVEFRCGESATELDRVLGERPDASVVLLDADHTTQGVRAEVSAVLRHRPDGVRVVLIHDVANADCRAGILSAEWSGCPWLHNVSVDFSDGKDGWGGLAVAWLSRYEEMNERLVHSNGR